jgi:hypothetical protein
LAEVQQQGKEVLAVTVPHRVHTMVQVVVVVKAQLVAMLLLVVLVLVVQENQAVLTEHLPVTLVVEAVVVKV